MPALTKEEIHRAFEDYPYARALLIQLAVSSEYIADSTPESLPNPQELAQRLQDLAQVACAVTNQDNYTGPRLDLDGPRHCLNCGGALGSRGDTAYQCYECLCKLSGIKLCVNCSGLLQEDGEAIGEDLLCNWCKQH